MNKYVILLALTTCVIAAPAQIQHPTAWLRADSAVLNASLWMDVSGNGYDATPSSGTMSATFSRMNFNKCFEVGGAETFTLPLGINDSRQSDVIVVYETYDTVSESALWQVQLDTAKRIGQTTRRILNDNGQITYDTANRLKPVINYLAQSWRTSGSTSSQPRSSRRPSTGTNFSTAMTSACSFGDARWAGCSSLPAAWWRPSPVSRRRWCSPSRGRFVPTT